MQSLQEAIAALDKAMKSLRQAATELIANETPVNEPQQCLSVINEIEQRRKLLEQMLQRLTKK
jgi:ubiquinone biosynthesis protein UbiJ